MAAPRAWRLLKEVNQEFDEESNSLSETQESINQASGCVGAFTESLSSNQDKSQVNDGDESNL